METIVDYQTEDYRISTSCQVQFIPGDKCP